jgi:hypothetical protein
MDSNTKKILIYGGGAILVGSIAFFVYSFFKKDKISIGKTDFILEKDEEKSTPKNSTVRFLPSEDISQGIGFTPSILKNS